MAVAELGPRAPRRLAYIGPAGRFVV